MSNDELVAFALGLVALSVVWAKRRRILTGVGRWMRQHHLTLADGRGLVDIPFLGGLDFARILAAAAVLGLAALGAWWLRPRRAEPDAARQRRRREQDAGADELN